MILSDEALLTAILEQREGGTYTNNPADAGGPTRWGITLATLAADRVRPTSAADVAALTEDEARSIYRRRYILKPGFARIADDQVRWLLVDSAVLHGPKNAVRFLQRAVGVMDDGVFGDRTFEALRLLNPSQLWDWILAERIAFTGRIITDNLTDADHDGIPDNTEFAKGWFNRFADILRSRA